MNLTLQEYFNRVYDQILQGNFDLVVFQGEPTSKVALHIEALNYMLYEWNEDHHDPRNIFDYILKPHDCDWDWDFTSITLEEFFQFITNQRDNHNQILNLETKEVTGTKKVVKPKKVKKSVSKPKVES